MSRAAAHRLSLYLRCLAAWPPDAGKVSSGQIAESVGVPGDVSAGFEQGRFERWVAQVTVEAFDSGVQGTPTILVDGEQFTGDPYTTGPLTDAIRQAIGDA